MHKVYLKYTKYIITYGKENNSKYLLVAIYAT